MKKNILYAGTRIIIESPEPAVVEALFSFFKAAGCPENRSAVHDLKIHIQRVPNLLNQKERLMEGRGFLTRNRGQGVFKEIYISNKDFLFYFGIPKTLFLVSPDRRLIEGWVEDSSVVKTIRFLQIALLEPIRFALHFQGIFFIHASGVAQGDRGVLFIGPPGAGKSNTALQLVKSGYQFLSDDKIGLRKKSGYVEMLFSPEWLGLRPRAGGLFGDIQKKIAKNGVRLFSSHEKIKVSMKHLYPDRICARACPKLIVFLKKVSKNTLRVSSFSKKEALLALLKENVILFSGKFSSPVGQKHFDVFSDLVNQTEVICLEYSMDRFCDVEPLVTRMFRRNLRNHIETML